MAQKQITQPPRLLSAERRRWLITVCARGSAMASPLILDEAMMLRFGDTIAADYTAWRNLTLLIALGASAGLQMRALELTRSNHQPTRATLRAQLRVWPKTGLPLLIAGISLVWFIGFLSTTEALIGLGAAIALAGLLISVELHRVSGNIIRYATFLPIGVLSLAVMLPFTVFPTGVTGLQLITAQCLGFWLLFGASYALLPRDDNAQPAPTLPAMEAAQLSIVAAAPQLASGLLPALLRSANLHSAAVAINLALRLGAMVSVPLIFLLTRFPEILRAKLAKDAKTNPVTVAKQYRLPLMVVSIVNFAIVIGIATTQPLGANQSREALIGATVIIGLAALVNVAVGPVKLSLTIMGETKRLFMATLASTTLLLITLPLALTGIYGAAGVAASFVITTNVLLFWQLHRAVRE